MTITLDPPTQRRLETLAKKQGRSAEAVAASLVAVSLHREPAADREAELLHLLS